MMAIDFSSTAADSPWLAAITWLKEIFDAEQNDQPSIQSPPVLKKHDQNGYKNTCLILMPKVSKNFMLIAMNFGFIAK